MGMMRIFSGVEKPLVDRIVIIIPKGDVDSIARDRHMRIRVATHT